MFFFTFFWLFYTVVNTIPYEMDKRVFQFVQYPLVNFNLCPADDQFRLFTLIVREVADQFRKDLHQRSYRKHHDLFHCLQMIVHHLFE